MVSFIPAVKSLNHEIHESHEKKQNIMGRSIAFGLCLTCAEIKFGAIVNNNNSNKITVYTVG